MIFIICICFSWTYRCRENTKSKCNPPPCLLSLTKSTKVYTALLKHCNHWVVTHRHTHETCRALMNIHSALYWGQRNAPFNFISEKINFEQKSQFREQVFTSMTGRKFCYYFYCVCMCLCVCTDRCLSHISRT